MERNKVILVNENDQVLGEMNKLEAHQKGLLHRAFSVFIFNSKGELLLQQRAAHKYHGAKLWTNTCCSHPQLNEDMRMGAEERLKYEMGLKCNLKFLYSFIYKAEVENNLIENEYDHVFIGLSDDEPTINKEEVQDYKWMNLNKVLEDINLNPEVYTYWFKAALPKVISNIKHEMLLTKY
ncbi:isopentenyl-diphosphate Delta-isomerase [Pedobacter sp.]|uniref:isopentenyl-diphosphate Delta-isomerase n=1 Tax=Pedobacter sp. TaxID=1411316 RepID=UPI00396C834A